MSRARIIFVGSGTSEGVPRVTCLARENPTCPGCLSSMRPGSKDRRRNTCIVVQSPHPEDTARLGVPVRNVLVDAGKFFYQSAIEMFPRFKVWTLDAVVLTHAHADAAGGLDDLRDWTNNNRQVSVPVYYRPEDYGILSKTHYYLVERSSANTAGTIAKLQFSETGREAFDAAGVRFIPLPVWHGKPHSANGYRVGGMCYIPDVSDIPDETRALVQGCDLLVIDALRRRRTHGSHLTVEQAVDEVRRLRPRRALLTGMCHEIVHDEVEAELRVVSQAEGLDIGLAWDGMTVDAEI